MDAENPWHLSITGIPFSKGKRVMSIPSYLEVNTWKFQLSFRTSHFLALRMGIGALSAVDMGREYEL